MPGGSFREPKVDSGMTLPFQPMTLTFTDMHYYVKCPPVCSHLTPCMVILLSEALWGLACSWLLLTIICD